MDFNTFEQLFEPFCKTEGVDSGKARSYFLAIKYLAEYLELPNLGNGNAYRILDKEAEVKDRGCHFYQELLRRWEDERRSSYLKNGFVQAAMPLFGTFSANNNLL